jgi:predicted transcriptional regulator
MTKQDLEILLEHVATWPDEAQEELVQSMVDIEKKHIGIYHLNDEERAAVRRGLREMREGKLASEDEVARAFARYRA